MQVDATTSLVCRRNDVCANDAQCKPKNNIIAQHIPTDDDDKGWCCLFVMGDDFYLRNFLAFSVVVGSQSIASP